MRLWLCVDQCDGRGTWVSSLAGPAARRRRCTWGGLRTESARGSYLFCTTFLTHTRPREVLHVIDPRAGAGAQLGREARASAGRRAGAARAGALSLRLRHPLRRSTGPRPHQRTCLSMASAVGAMRSRRRRSTMRIREERGVCGAFAPPSGMKVSERSSPDSKASSMMATASSWSFTSWPLSEVICDQSGPGGVGVRLVGMMATREFETRRWRRGRGHKPRARTQTRSPWRRPARSAPSPSTTACDARGVETLSRSAPRAGVCWSAGESGNAHQDANAALVVR